MKFNRSALKWFAAGAATSAVVTVVSAAVVHEPEPLAPYLRVAEPYPAPTQERDDEVASFGGRMLRECGAKTLEITAWGTDIQSYAYLPLTQENAKALQCAVKQSAGGRFEVDLVFRAGSPQ